MEQPEDRRKGEEIVFDFGLSVDVFVWSQDGDIDPRLEDCSKGFLRLVDARPT